VVLGLAVAAATTFGIVRVVGPAASASAADRFLHRPFAGSAEAAPSAAAGGTATTAAQGAAPGAYYRVTMEVGGFANGSAAAADLARRWREGGGRGADGGAGEAR